MNLRSRIWYPVDGSDPRKYGADGMPSIPEKELYNRERAWREVHIAYGDGISVNVHCLDDNTVEAVNITAFDGRNWEQNVSKLSPISD